MVLIYLVMIDLSSYIHKIWSRIPKFMITSRIMGFRIAFMRVINWEGKSVREALPRFIKQEAYKAIRSTQLKSSRRELSLTWIQIRY